MRYALLSDIHANLPALRGVLTDIDARGDVDAIYHLGDLTGYAPWPNEVVALLRERRIPGIAGNYDSTIATGYKHCGCSAENARHAELSHLSYEWTRSRVTPDTRRYLASLPFRIDIRALGGHVSGPTITLLHGNQTLNTVYVTDNRSSSFLEKMAAEIGARAGDAICFGHTHKPWQRVVGDVRFINAGSVGRPKDGDWRACYALLSAGNGGTQVEFIRVRYDVDQASLAIRQSELPDEFADVLESGAPSAALAE